MASGKLTPADKAFLIELMLHCRTEALVMGSLKTMNHNDKIQRLKLIKQVKYEKILKKKHALVQR